MVFYSLISIFAPMKRLGYVLMAALPLVLCLLLGGCGDNPRAVSLLTRADSLMAGRPDSALLLLDSCEAEVAAWPESQQMRFHLLHAKAQNKAYVPFTSDSVMTVVSHYYDRHGTNNEQVEAHYLLGCVYRDLGEAPKALSAYHDAVECADTTAADCDYALLARLHAQMADLLERMQLPYEALAETRLSIRDAYNDGDTLMAISSEAFLSNIYYLIGNNDSVINICNKVCEAFLHYEDTLYAFSYLGPAISVYLTQDSLDKAKELIDRQEELYRQYYNTRIIGRMMNSVYLRRAEYYRKTGLLDSAQYYCSLVDPSSSSNTALLLYRELSHYYAAINSPDSALKYSDQYFTMDDTVYRQSVRRDFQQMHSLYNYERNERIIHEKENRLRITRLTTMVIVALLVLLIIILLTVGYSFRTRMRSEMNKLNSSYTETLEKHKEANAQLALMKKSLESGKASLALLQNENNTNALLISRLEQEVNGYSEQITRKQEEIEQLKQTISVYLEEEGPHQEWNYDTNIIEHPSILCLHEFVKSGKRPTDRELEEIKRLSEIYYPDFCNKVKELYPKISVENMLMCILIKLRFIASELGIIFDLKPQSVSNRRRELHKIMFKKNGGAKEFDYKIRIL